MSVPRKIPCIQNSKKCKLIYSDRMKIRICGEARWEWSVWITKRILLVLVGIFIY